MSSLKFGTSGLRGLVTDLVGEAAIVWTQAFLHHLEREDPATQKTLMVGRDLRSSSPQIASNCVAAAQACGWTAIDCGELPTPALAMAVFDAGAAGVMVTGSHIPDDRNGLKFYRSDGEITKSDEAGILARFTASTPVAARSSLPVEDRSHEALQAYKTRYTRFFDADALAGLTVGIYQQSTVARDLLVEILSMLGAKVVVLGRSDQFVPVDTEAHRPEDVTLIREWAASNRFDAIISADGDADRPLVADQHGQILRGDLLGLLTASSLGLTTLATPVTSSSAVERSGVATSVYRTRVGSPYVIEAMVQATASGHESVLGFEANGGVLLGSSIVRNNKQLKALPTRDAVLPIIAALIHARTSPLHEVPAQLRAGIALANRLQNIPSATSRQFVQRLESDAPYAENFFRPAGSIASLNALDGLKVTLQDGATVHFRPSGNAPEFRCYVEAESAERAEDLLQWGLAASARELGQT
ncbi:phosphomannomutase [Aureimonas fodinaquatilis]|uniref:Phosphomannomutase n=1 Tax=Aureimonas fodinaquatilis TaxID=2565783 RepID=A0A5B0DZ04_9HYPH|nr:phosphomannomutase [Aureimonas fodinaquatilis]KAA0971763.1 phosphomannomutase [Aureimonas fodinaquatilis]